MEYYPVMIYITLAMGFLFGIAAFIGGYFFGYQRAKIENNIEDLQKILDRIPKNPAVLSDPKSGGGDIDVTRKTPSSKVLKYPAPQEVREKKEKEVVDAAMVDMQKTPRDGGSM